MIRFIQHAGAGFASWYRDGAVRDYLATLAVILGFAALAFMPLFFLAWLMQPKVLANPGTAVRVVPRIVYAEPPPADLDLLQAAEAPGRDVMQLQLSQDGAPVSFSSFCAQAQNRSHLFCGPSFCQQLYYFLLTQGKAFVIQVQIGARYR